MKLLDSKESIKNGKIDYLGEVYMTIILLMVIYVAFIGLGLPDSLFGPAWPAIYKEFNIPVSFQAFVTMTVTFGTILSSILSSKIINKVGTRNVVVVSTGLTVLGLLGFYLSNAFWLLIISAIPLGIGAGAIDSALNNYVAIHYKQVHMNFLHCFYGIGVTLSPYIMSMALSTDNNWKKGYMIAFFIQLSICLILVLSMPLWNKVKKKNSTSSFVTEPIPFNKMIKTPIIVVAGLIFFFYCGIELTTGHWSASFLVNAKNINPDQAAALVGLFYGGLAIGRFTSGLVSTKLSSFKLVFIGEAILLIACVLFALPLSGIIYSGIALFLVGFGCGPIFPNMAAITPTYYGEKYSQSIMGIQMSLAYTSSITLSPLFGIIGEKISFKIFPYYILGFSIILISLSFVILTLYKSRKQLF